MVYLLGLKVGKVVLAPRGELFEQALALKSFKKRVFLTGVRFLKIYRTFEWVATDESEKAAILKQFPASTRISIASDIPALPPLEHLTILGKTPKSLGILFLSRIAPVKNLLFALEVLSKVPPGYAIVFDIYGTMEDPDLWARCLQKIAGIQNVQIEYRGALHPEQVPETLSRYHLFFLPTQTENFGHAIFEALAAGTITLISDQTPWQNLEQAGAGWDLPLSSPDAFLEKILYLADADREKIDTLRRNARSYAERFFMNSEAVEQNRLLFNKMP